MASRLLAGGQSVTIFEDEPKLVRQLVQEVTETARAAISAKGSFSLCLARPVIPALKDLSPDALDWSKVNVFLTGELLGANSSYSEALATFGKKCPVQGIFYPILRPLFSTGTGLPAFAAEEAAGAYGALLKSHPAIDNAGPMPSFDLLLLGLGDDGHCGFLHPESNQVKATGKGKVVLSICQSGKSQIAVSMDVMRAAKKTLVTATGAGKKDAVRRALSGVHGPFDCPAGLLSKAPSTTWFVDKAAFADFERTSTMHSGLPGLLPAARLEELKETATKLCAPGKGFLAADESAGPWLRAGHAEAAKIPDVVENRAAYRAMCFSTPGLSEHISGVILHWETLMQEDAKGKPMVEIIKENGMIPGIKVDKGYNKKGIWGTSVGPLGHPEVATLGLDDLQQRCAQAYKEGARFAKWRNVLQLDPMKGLPSNLSINDTVHTLARYASICQSEGLVPIVEPEIVPNGSHDIFYCAEVTNKVLKAQFRALAAHHVYLEGAVLKPNMVKNGLEGPKASAETIATLTCQTLLRTVPPSMPGIFFLSGETALNEDNEEEATINLSTMNRLFAGKLPWHLSFSYGKALQKTCIVTWLGKAENEAAAQKALKARSQANSDAVFGKYTPGSCASVGTDGNVMQAAGPY
ncbi:FBA3 [Symbiodinium natans]|uniref:fructose-bisphosphate aldolase n=1 Tax=Symbiodinium natans TaxID=878477 RepID=A0A812JZW4_9DINO|nr:FBA3 [Symbiodinium natans]